MEDRPARRWPRRRILKGLGIASAVALVVLAFLLWPFWQLSRELATRQRPAPSRLYGQPLEVRIDQLLTPEELVAELRALGYRPWDGVEPLRAGSYRASGSAVGVVLRPHPSEEGWQPKTALEVKFHGRRVTALRQAGQPADSARLEPPLLASFHGPAREERWPVKLEDLPESVVQAVLAVEDDGFFSHQGLSVSGILRAAFVNLRGGEVRQGGSTLTQQLVKNVFLSHERTVSRKIKEAVLAVLVELRYDKPTLLEAYLNEIYLGRRDGLNLIGVGAASRAFFGKHPAELDLAESALLAGLIRAPALYDPLDHPAKARERRDQVLDRIAKLGWVGPEPIARAKEREIEAAPAQPLPHQTGYFAHWAAREAEHRFGIGGFEDGGYYLLATLRRDDQIHAEDALRHGLEGLERGWEKSHDSTSPLQAALVSVDPTNGEILAYLGGRDFTTAPFDRASEARRQAGSAFKPVIYGAAFEARVAAPSSLVEDSPLTVRLAGRSWSPKNDDRSFDGWMTIRTAVERSRNVPTVRLALQVGLDKIVALARRLGITTPLKPLPSLALGAFEVTPAEMASVYSTLANGGLRQPVHGLRAVLTSAGQPLPGTALPEPERALSPQSAYLLTSVLQGVFERGTAKRARQEGLREPLAGKTGTTNGRRDSWFAGFSGDRATVVWVGYDDNASTHLSGARAALPIWTRFMVEVRPAGGFSVVRQPPGVVTASVDPETGELASDRCPSVITEVFLDGAEPASLCHLHAPFSRPWLAPDRSREAPRHPLRSWLDRVFRNRRESSGVH
ncbi:MAG: PBP1A family penicillin-binding protein [Acidobacteria bacterium]|nr:PBP1A family penicillin-binding protein [Acidobacteriota bacterium]